MASIEQIARNIDAIDEPDKVLRLHAIAKAISDDFAPGYMPRSNEYPPPKDETMSSLSNRKKRKLAGKARDAVNALAAFADELDDPAEVAFTDAAKELIADLATEPAEAEQDAKCEDCGGTGRDRVPYGERCDACKGSGEDYTPPCEAPYGFEWAGEYRALKAGDWYQHPETENVGPLAMQADGDCLDHMTRHILRKLPAAPKPEDQVPPATRTADGAAGQGGKPLKPGDKRGVEVYVVDGDPDEDGDVIVYLDPIGNFAVAASALRETQGGGE